MIHTDMPNKKIHQGRNIKRFREMLGIKQEALAFELGDDWNQKKVSLLEQKETVESDILAQVAKILKVPAEAIENFDEEQAVNVISNTFTSNDTSTLNAVNIHPTFNPIDKMVELYERMLQQQKEMIEKLERLIERK
ncbi:helix-turn-helix transcriptional regulator [Elizabethkingia anophelis]|nr:helix-turn-helix transcriptional regulator [Elizabethkingia anophelis]